MIGPKEFQQLLNTVVSGFLSTTGGRQESSTGILTQMTSNARFASMFGNKLYKRMERFKTKIYVYIIGRNFCDPEAGELRVFVVCMKRFTDRL